MAARSSSRMSTYCPVTKAMCSPDGSARCSRIRSGASRCIDVKSPTKLKPVHRPMVSQTACSPPLRASLPALHGAASSFMRAWRSPSMRRSTHMNISV